MAFTFDEKALTLRDILLFTQSMYPNRFDYMDRDVLKGLSIRTIKNYAKDRHNQPDVKYIITTYSYPQYKPYVQLKGSKSKKQMKVKHQYDITIQLESMDMDSKIRWRTGSQRKVNKNKVPWKKIKQVHSSVRERYQKKFKNDKVKYKKALENHRKRATFESEGDFWAKEAGINLDWYYRVAYKAEYYGNAYGKVWYQGDDVGDWPFYDKHILRAILFLIKKGYIKV